MSDFISKAFNHAKTTLESFLNDESNISRMDEVITLLSDSLKKRSKVISCGNGGSMCDAMHFAEELTGRFRKERPALPAVAISDPSHLTCVANDYGVEYVFSKFVDAHGNTGDILLAISTSGNSPNIVRAVESAKKQGMKTIGLLGKGGGKLKDLVDYPFVIDATISDRIQEMHIKIIHIFIEGVERNIFPENY